MDKTAAEAVLSAAMEIKTGGCPQVSPKFPTYSKGEMSDLSAKELEALKRMVETWQQ